MNAETAADRMRVYLIGSAPKDYHNIYYVKEKPYQAVMLGVLSPGELLHMPDDIVCKALLDGIPVFLWSRQAHHGKNHAAVLRRKLDEAERGLMELGVQRIGDDPWLITADFARNYVKNGFRMPDNYRLTPLAKDILEGKT